MSSIEIMTGVYYLRNEGKYSLNQERELIKFVQNWLKDFKNGKFDSFPIIKQLYEVYTQVICEYHTRRRKNGIIL